MKRVLVVQPSLQPPGGGNGVAAWALQALVPHHRVTVLTWRPIELSAINSFYGTNLRAGDFDSLTVPGSWRVVLDRLPVPVTLVKNALLMRHMRAHSSSYDVVFGLFNENDFGRRAIQYVHYPTYLRPRPSVDLRWYHRSSTLLHSYYALADRIAGFSLDRLKSNVTLVNSDWTGTHLERFLGVSARTVYPPVVNPRPGRPWPERRNAFLAVGRISPEKEYERVMRILARVRTRHDITLTVVGTHDRHARRYLASLKALAESLGPWIDFQDNVTRDELAELMASCRYGIHGMREEHFGMAPAEMARAGMIVWVPDGGGQVEIVGGEPALTYRSDEDARDKIARTLDSESEQQRLRSLLARSGERFSADTFMREIRAVVDRFPA